jgi:hypothetical protein
MIFVVDRDTGAKAAATNVISGFGVTSNTSSFSGPLPKGSYSLLEQGARPNFIRLEANDSHFGDDRVQGTERTNLRLHSGTLSLGCVTMCNKVQGEGVMNLIKGTKTSTSEVESKSRNPFASGTETVRQYGTLYATDNYKISLDKNNVVHVTWTQTGSRIEREISCTLQSGGGCK